MDPEKVPLNETHRRSLTSSLIIAEGLLIEIRDLLGKEYNTCCLEIKNDIESTLVPLNIQIETDRDKYPHFAGKKAFKNA